MGDSIEMPPDIPEAVARVIKASVQVETKGVAYDFVSDDEHWTVGLTRSFLALSTGCYQRWEDYREHLLKPLGALIDTYRPSFFARAGLRYQNVIRKSALGLDGVAWEDLLRSQIVGLLAAKDFQGEAVETSSQTLIEFPERVGKVRLRHGFVQAANNNEQCYLIDSDFFTSEKTKVEDVTDVLNYFNQQSGRLFRWCITDRLHEAMGPQPVTG
jgi:uncharacterized protein (TIGR04255 family)